MLYVLGSKVERGEGVMVLWKNYHKV